MASRTGLMPAVVTHSAGNKFKLKKVPCGGGRPTATTTDTSGNKNTNNSLARPVSSKRKVSSTFGASSLKGLKTTQSNVNKIQSRQQGQFDRTSVKSRSTLMNRRSTPGAVGRPEVNKGKSLTRTINKSGQKLKQHRYSTPAQPTTPVVNKLKTSPKKSILKRPAPTAEITEEPAHTHDITCSSRHVTFKSKGTEQASLRAKLNAWLESKGKTPSKCRHLMCFDAEMSAKKKRVKLVDRTLSSNLLDKQNEALEKEEASAKKKLFDVVETSSPCKEENLKENQEPCKENDGEAEKHSTEDVMDTEVQFTTSMAVPSPAPDVASPFTQPPQGADDDVAVCKHIKVMLEECLILFEAGCPLESILQWLQEMENSISRTTTFAPFYICKARVLSAHPERMLEVLCQAVRSKAEPSHLLATEMWNLLHPIVSQSETAGDATFSLPSSPQSSTQKTDAVPNHVEVTETDKPSTPELVDNVAEKEETPVLQTKHGRVLRFSVTATTPLLSRPTDNTPLAVVTPVRRSIRLSNRVPTPSLRREIESLSDLSEAERQTMLYKENVAITGE